MAKDTANFSFYASMPKRYTDAAERLRKLMEDKAEWDWNDVMKEYFGDKWNEFRRWWLERTDEPINWQTFALAPHNAVWFVSWAFFKDEDLMTRVMRDMDASGL